MDISVTVIVKDDAENLSKCLASVKEIEGEIIVVDTGSSDSSIDVAKSYGAKVFEMPWKDDFSIARNFSLSRASKKWILQLDADEELDPAGIDEIKKIVSTASNDPEHIDVYAFRVIDLASSEIYYLNRLFLRESYTYTGKIHERLVRINEDESEKRSSEELDEPPLDMVSNLNSVKTNISMIHKGYLAENIEKFDKTERNLRMLLAMHEDDPNDQMTNFYLGATHQSAGNNDEAAQFYQQVVSSPQNLHFPNAYKNLMRVYEASKDLPRAISVAEDGLLLFPQFTTLRFHLGIAKYLSGDLGGAADAFRQCLGSSSQNNKDANFTVVPGIDLLCRVFIGLTDFEMTKDQNLLKSLDKLMLELSNDPDALFYLGKTFINAYGAQGAEEQFKKLANLRNPQVNKCFELLFGRNAK